MCTRIMGATGTKAAIDAGYSRTRAKVTASELLADEDVRQEIDAELARQIERIRVSSDKVVREMAKIAFANLSDIVEIRQVKSGRSIRQELVLKADSLDRLNPDDVAAIRDLAFTEGGVRVRLHDKMAALMGLSKHLAGHFRDPLSPAAQRPRHTPEERIALMGGLLQVFAKRRNEAIGAGQIGPSPARDA